jgi:putative ABC transport system permease protein
MFETITQDVRFALRTLIRSPGFTSVAVIVLALGIGANTAIFSAVNAFFFRPLPFADADRLVTLYETNPEFGWDDASAAPANMFDWREQVEAFADVSAYFSNALTAFQDAEPLLITGTQVVGNFFTTLGVVPMMGRTFRMEETWDGEDDGIVISHALWVSYFGSDPDVIGKRIEFAIGDGEVLGVMPRGFRFPSEQRSGAHSA